MSKPMKDLRNELLLGVADHVQEILIDHGIEPDVAAQCGAAIADYLADDWGGQIISVPKDYYFRLAKRDLAILDEFTGGNYFDLARQYKMTVRGIRKLIKRTVIRQRDDLQLSLLDD